jgi:deazaflavin-dependent oxidoreductase (nitroreductase family)
MTLDLSSLGGEAFCYLTTIGRISGRPHTIEIWFALHGRTLYMLSGGKERADWVQNAGRQPTVTVKIKDTLLTGKARLVHNRAEDALARELVGEKYRPSEPDLEGWLQSSLPVAVDLEL